MTVISRKRYGEERALYASKDVILNECSFEGCEDGESALKESARITANGCKFTLRYPLWHTKEVRLVGCEMTKECRAAIWYGNQITIHGSRLMGIKAIRECNGVVIEDCIVTSPELGWFSSDITIKKSEIEAEYLMLRAKNVNAIEMKMKGKYSFQYIEDSIFENCRLDTKDAFWHSKNVTLRGCELNGEYLGWYSEGLTLYDCKIRGTQPFCYCKNLRLVNCEMLDCDLAFEKSSVDAEIISYVCSVKNPESGRIAAKGYGEIIVDAPTGGCEIVVLK